MLPNDYATRHTLSANTLFILLSIEKAHMHILLLLQNLVELIDANTVLRVQQILVRRRIIRYTSGCNEY
jgi:hypothetical protein